MKKRKRERKHRVKAHLKVEELAKAGSALELEIFADQEKIGTVSIGRGSFTWFGKNREKGKRISWSRFAQMLDEECYGRV